MSSSPPFPLLQLPLLAQLEVLKNMNPLAVLTFSVLSKRSKAIAVELKYPLKTCKWIFYYWNEICLEPDSGKKEAHLTFLTEDYQQDIMQMNNNNKSAIITLNGQDIRISLDRERWIIDYDPQWGRESLKLTDKFTEHIFTVFRFKEYALHAHRWINIAECFVWKNTTTLKHLFINDRFELTDSGMQFVLEQLKVTELEVMRFRMDPRFNYTGPLPMDFLRAPTIDWISRESIRNMKCSRVWVDRLVNAEQLNTMLKDWQQGGLANLKNFWSRLYGGYMDEILEGIETFDWNPEKRPQCWRHELLNVDIDLSKCKDIVRADGTLATVKIDNESKSWQLFVWHPKYLRQ